MKRICLLLFLPAYLFAQTSGITTTKEYYPNNKIRRIIKTDNDFNVISEIYYRNSNSLPIAEIDYRSKNEIKSVVFFKNDGINKKYLIDFNRGLYIDYLNNISLSFKDNFVFDGKQTGNKTTVYN